MAESKSTTRKSPLSRAINRAWRTLPTPRIGPDPLESREYEKAVEAWAETMQMVDVRDRDDAGAFIRGVMQETFAVAAKALAGLLEMAHPPQGDPELRAWFWQYNLWYFAGRLPAVPVDWPALDWLRDGATLGVCYYSHPRYFGPVILLSPVLAVGSMEFQETLLHEMVHLKLHAEGRDNGRPHGADFRREVERLREQGAPVEQATYAAVRMPCPDAGSAQDARPHREEGNSTSRQHPGTGVTGPVLAA